MTFALGIIFASSIISTGIFANLPPVSFSKLKFTNFRLAIKDEEEYKENDEAERSVEPTEITPLNTESSPVVRIPRKETKEKASE